MLALREYMSPYRYTLLRILETRIMSIYTGYFKHLESGFFSDWLIFLFACTQMPPHYKCCLSLDYITAAYPPALIILTYTLYSQTPLPQLYTSGLALQTLHWIHCSFSKAAGHSTLICGCLCNLPPSLPHQVFRCFI